ncbi:MAG TPA: MotA/TolQ/ExbB proton channel family protein [Anaerohalosphaeraceae bacterium]|nr:MotA/TolQ/ExbB proton channel family protein [Anaerohalosphaeraceae bacterium]
MIRSFRTTILHRTLAAILLALGLVSVGYGQSQTADVDASVQKIQQKLDDSLAELAAFRQQMAEELLPLNRRINELENRLLEVRRQYQQTSRLLDGRTLDLSTLRNEIKARQEEASYLSGLLGEYIRNFESRLHIAELQRYRAVLEEAKLAAENRTLSPMEVYEAQGRLLLTALDRLEEALGGARFEGAAVDSTGLVQKGTFVLLGPIALFRSQDGQVVGTVEQQLGSLEPTVLPFENPQIAQTAAELIETSQGLFPLDPTLGNARKIEQTRETLLEHIQKGGPVMIPIFALAGAAFLVALFKWFSMLWIRMPSAKKISAFLKAVAKMDSAEAKEKARVIRGPIGQMLRVGAEHMNEPRELVEEILYEKILAVRLKLERFLPFIAVSAACAPLLGLLGTVTGIINTFKLITVFGSGDVKTLSGGISEALITTEFGLIVAIPSLLIHAFLSRKSKGILNQMEKTAFAFLNELAKAAAHAPSVSSAPAAAESARKKTGLEPSLQIPPFVQAEPETKIADILVQILALENGDSLERIFVVDKAGKYLGSVRVQELLARPVNTPVEHLLDRKESFIRIDAHPRQVQKAFEQYKDTHLPILDHQDRLVGQMSRNALSRQEIQ